MLHRRHSWLLIIWIVVGLVVAWERSYITLKIVEVALSAVLTIVLWPLVLIGVNLHIH